MLISLNNWTIFIIAILSAVWVYIDSRKYKKAVLIGSSLNWAFLTFLFWLPTFPLYITYKLLKYQKQINNPSYRPNKLVLIPIIVLIWTISVPVIIYYLLNSIRPF